MHRQLTIALFGAYGQENFGDDLMAVQIATFLHEHGYKVRVYQLDTERCQIPFADRVQTVDALLHEADACVIGGGSWLLPHTNRQYQLTQLADLSVLCKLCESREIPIFALSVGGAELGATGNIPLPVARMFSSYIFQGATVRLPQDVDTIRLFNKRVCFYPDIVLCSHSLIEPHRGNIKCRKRPRIGLNIQNTRQNRQLLLCLEVLSHLGYFDLALLTTHPKGSCHDYEIDRFFVGIGKPIFYCENPKQMLNVLCRECDVIISNKLHLGISALSLQKKFISLNPAPKTAKALRSLNLENCVIVSRKKMLISLMSKNIFSSLPVLPKNDSEEAFKHFVALADFLEKFA